ncbi:GNAT family N-acetyltransferase [Halalkalibacter okhensis]|uniref:N-acetyltransferase domain-containing protein n=1 Tax=Halalkalibacter okhensis TaxID=333138 RepID=A0A0B0IGI8_9BACI|nr:GNAT family N-acetyltransferase [Halalkalibacter okhensis]KHF38776.1 hypothetical protein LQ50_19220 [Halalkalibacter okhensis]
MLKKSSLNEIKQLQHFCEQEEGIELKLNWDLLETRKAAEKSDFFHYEGEQLVGFLALYSFGNKVEICGMVHPKNRRQGIFTQLLTEALEELKKQSFHSILLNTPANSKSGKAFANKYSRYSFSEYQMKWEATDLKPTYDQVSLRPAQADDFDFIIELDAACFQMEKKEAATMYELGGTSGSVIIDYEHNKVGKLRWHEEKEQSWIYGFAVAPKAQGKGIGREALIQAVLEEVKKGQEVFLEVVPENEHALHLYTSCGFRQVSTQDYYEMKAI